MSKTFRILLKTQTVLETMENVKTTIDREYERYKADSITLSSSYESRKSDFTLCAIENEFETKRKTIAHWINLT